MSPAAEAASLFDARTAQMGSDQLAHYSSMALAAIQTADIGSRLRMLLADVQRDAHLYDDSVSLVIEDLEAAVTHADCLFLATPKSRAEQNALHFAEMVDADARGGL